VVDRMKVTLLEMDRALEAANNDLQRACAALDKMQTAMAEKETALATAQTQLQQDRATLEGAQSWQAQAEQKAKEAERLGADLREKAASHAAVDEQLRQERSARQQAETRLQQEQSALEEAQAALERERSAREEAQGQLQREHAALEKAQATLKLRDAEITRLTRELVQEGVSYEELRQAGEEKDAAILELHLAAKTVRAALETEKKQVEGKSPLLLFACWLSSSRSALDLLLIFAFRPADGSWDVGDPGRGDPDSLQLLSVGAGRLARCGPRGVSRRGGGRCAGRELHGEPSPCLGRSCHPACVKCVPPGVPEDPRCGAVALPSQSRSAVHGLRRPRGS
jgi:hypothetical protein